jgi:hypothetical protein
MHQIKEGNKEAIDRHKIGLHRHQTRINKRVPIKQRLRINHLLRTKTRETIPRVEIIEANNRIGVTTYKYCFK